jgi:XTP/dITP diphosphohydrolase
MIEPLYSKMFGLEGKYSKEGGELQSESGDDLVKLISQSVKKIQRSLSTKQTTQDHTLDQDALLLPMFEQVQKVIHYLFDYGLLYLKSGIWYIKSQKQIDDYLDNLGKEAISTSLKTTIISTINRRKAQVVEWNIVPQKYIEMLNIKNFGDEHISQRICPIVVDLENKKIIFAQKTTLKNIDHFSYKQKESIVAASMQQVSTFLPSQKIRFSKLLEHETTKETSSLSLIHIPLFTIDTKSLTKREQSRIKSVSYNEFKKVQSTFSPQFGKQVIAQIEEKYNSKKSTKSIIIGTNNLTKIAFLKQFLTFPGIELVSLGLEKHSLEINEFGYNEIDNARLKAFSYFEKTHIPSVGMDIGLRLIGIPDTLQPNTHVKRVAGVCEGDTDDIMYKKMIIYYKDIIKKYSKSDKIEAKLGYGFSLFDGYEYTDSLIHQRVILSSVPHKKKITTMPLLSLIIDPVSGKYYFDLTTQELNNFYSQFSKFKEKIFFHVYNDDTAGRTTHTITTLEYDELMFQQKTQLTGEYHPTQQYVFHPIRGDLIPVINRKNMDELLDDETGKKNVICTYSMKDIRISTLDNDVDYPCIPLGYFDIKYGENEIHKIILCVSSQSKTLLGNMDYLDSHIMEEYVMGESVTHQQRIKYTKEIWEQNKQDPHCLVLLIDFSTGVHLQLISTNGILTFEDITNCMNEYQPHLYIQQHIQKYGYFTHENNDNFKIKKTSIESQNHTSILHDSGIQWQYIRNEIGQKIGERELATIDPMVYRSIANSLLFFQRKPLQYRIQSVPDFIYFEIMRRLLTEIS